LEYYSFLLVQERTKPACAGREKTAKGKFSFLSFVHTFSSLNSLEGKFNNSDL